MASKRHESDAAVLGKTYEENEIRLKGIVGFGIGLFFLIVITFGLMAALLWKLEQINVETAGPANPLALTDKERLPPEPRLQAAPGFAVESEGGRVNLELREPQAEYRELQKQWQHMLEFGEKDPRSGTVVVMPIDKAKDKLLEEKPKAKSGPEAEELWKNSRLYISDASSGRVAGETRR